MQLPNRQQGSITEDLIWLECGWKGNKRAGIFIFYERHKRAGFFTFDVNPRPSAIELLGKSHAQKGCRVWNTCWALIRDQGRDHSLSGVFEVIVEVLAV